MFIQCLIISSLHWKGLWTRQDKTMFYLESYSGALAREARLRSTMGK